LSCELIALRSCGRFGVTHAIASSTCTSTVSQRPFRIGGTYAWSP
jgi:hypothetical protein